MSLTLFSTVFEVGFNPREVPAAPVRPVSSPPVAAQATGSQRSEPEDIVETGTTQNGTDESQTGLFEQSAEKFQLASHRTRYAVDLESQEVVIKVIDPDTQEELRQIPSEEHRELARRIQQYQDIAFGK